MTVRLGGTVVSHNLQEQRWCIGISPSLSCMKNTQHSFQQN